MSCLHISTATIEDLGDANCARQKGSLASITMLVVRLEANKDKALQIVTKMASMLVVSDKTPVVGNVCRSSIACVHHGTRRATRNAMAA